MPLFYSLYNIKVTPQWPVGDLNSLLFIEPSTGLGAFSVNEVSLTEVTDRCHIIELFTNSRHFSEYEKNSVLHGMLETSTSQVDKDVNY